MRTFFAVAAAFGAGILVAFVLPSALDEYVKSRPEMEELRTLRLEMAQAPEKAKACEVTKTQVDKLGANLNAALAGPWQ